MLINPELAKVGDIDTAVITLTYQDGTMAIIDNSREASYGYDQRVEVFGSKGMVKADNNLHDTHKLFDSKGSHGALPLDFFIERYMDAYKKEIEDKKRADAKKSGNENKNISDFDGAENEQLDEFVQAAYARISVVISGESQLQSTEEAIRYLRRLSKTSWRCQRPAGPKRCDRARRACSMCTN